VSPTAQITPRLVSSLITLREYANLSATHPATSILPIQQENVLPYAQVAFLPITVLLRVSGAAQVLLSSITSQSSILSVMKLTALVLAFVFLPCLLRTVHDCALTFVLSWNSLILYFTFV
jgi:hypothetical protein